MSHWSAFLAPPYACHAAYDWCRKRDSAEAAWATCHRGDWLLWISARLAKTEEQRRTVVLAACAVARTALRHVPEGEERPRICLDVTEAWARGEATIEQVREARRNADAAAAAADAAYAAYAAAAAANAAYAAAYAYSAAYAAYAYSAAYAADAAYAAAAADDARATSLRASADIVRKMLPMPKVPS